jgi:anti-anti-sigma factor
MTTAAVFQVIDPGPVIVATIEGEIDLANADVVLDQIMEAVVNDAEGLVLDLTGLRYLDSTGIARLVQVHRVLEQRRQGLVVVAHPGSAIRRLLAITHVEDAIPVTSTLEEARAVARALSDDSI